MAGTVTNNFNFSLQGAGDNVGTWGTTGAGGEAGLNSGIFTPLDAILGSNLTVAMSNGNNSLSLQNWLNGIFVLTGTITAPATLILPLSPNSVGSATAVGGKFVVINNTSGNFSVTVKTAATGSTGVVIPQTPPSFSGAGTTWGLALYSDTVNVSYQNYGVEGFAKASNGNPNGALAGVAAGPVTNASLAFDYLNGILYICTTTGTTSTAVWTNVVSGALPIPTPEGRLTTVNNTPVLSSDTLSAATIFYTPFTGTWTAIHNGSIIVPYKFSQMQLTLSGQSANSIYDVYLAYNGGTPVIGTGPVWTSTTSRGASATIQRDSSSGLWVNGAIMSLTWNTGSGNTTINNVPVGQLIYLGSISIDSVAGQVSCYLSWGQNRKFGVWNAYNRQTISLLGGDSTVSWQPAGNTGVWIQSNGSVNNTIAVFCGLQEELVTISFSQFVQANRTNTAIGIGVLGATSSPSGQNGNVTVASVEGSQTQANYTQPPFIGINNVNMLENHGSGGSAGIFYGTNPFMQMVCNYKG